MDLFDLSSALFGRKGMDSDSVEYEETTRTYVGTATSDSADGSVYVELSEDVTMPDEYEGEHGMGVEMPTVPGVSEGDEVLVTVFGSGAMKSPVVTGNAGEGDRQNAAIAAAHAVATAAQAVADAVNQHFWHDTNGAHVTEATQEEWEQSHSGPNSLWNSLGMLFRDGLNNLLALVTGQETGVAIYDGNGNDPENVVASFTGTEVSLGANSNSSAIDMCGGAFKFDVDTSDANNVVATIQVDQNAIDDHTSNTPTLRILSGTDTDGRGIEILGNTGVQYPVSVISYGGGETTQHVGMGSLGIQTPAINFGSYSGTVEAYGGIYMMSRTGTNFWSTVPGTVLWSGAYHMTASHTATLAHNVSTCPTGIVLHWQAYVNGSAANQDQCYCFVPKSHVANFAGGGVQMPLMTSGFGKVGCKYVYVYDDRVTGAANNNQSGTASGITYNNAYWVLTQIIAV